MVPSPPPPPRLVYGVLDPRQRTLGSAPATAAATTLLLLLLLLEGTGRSHPSRSRGGVGTIVGGARLLLLPPPQALEVLLQLGVEVCGSGPTKQTTLDRVEGIHLQDHPHSSTLISTLRAPPRTHPRRRLATTPARRSAAAAAAAAAGARRTAGSTIHAASRCIVAAEGPQAPRRRVQSE